jgi:AcrR family transcriptional regulator
MAVAEKTGVRPTRISKPAKRPVRTRVQDPEGVKRDILKIATEEFAQNGLSGSRIDEIAAKTRTSKRMIYYYFGDKDGLYLAVLEEAYRGIRAIEARLDLQHLDPVSAIRRLVEFTFDYQSENEYFIRLVMIENIHHAEFLAKSKAIQQLNVTAIDTIREVYGRGVKEGLFRKGIDAVDLHWSISALCFFNVSNRATFAKIFKGDPAAAQAMRRQIAVDMILRYVSK